MKSNDLKSLQVRKNKIESEINNLKSDKSNLDKIIADKCNKLYNLNNQIKILQKEVIVSEHAILRYVERVLGINIEEIKKTILTEENKKLIKVMQSGRIKKSDYILVVRNNTVVTVEIKN